MINKLLLSLFLLLFFTSGCDNERYSSFHDAIDVCVGANHSCAVRANGNIECWGLNSDGQTNVPNYSDFKAVSCGDNSACGLRTDGSISCWGPEESCAGDTCFKTAVFGPPLEKEFVQIVLGGTNGCALKSDGTVHCWGDAYYDSILTPPDVKFSSIIGDGYGYLFCGLSIDGEISCWGNRSKLFPAPDWQDPNFPLVRLPDGMQFSYVAINKQYACGAVKETPREVFCWGVDAHENLTPNGYSWNTEELPIVRIDTNADFKCIKRRGKKYKCFGRQEEWSLSYPPDDNFVQLSMHSNHGCGLLEDGHVRCWGDNFKGKSSPP